LHRWGIHDPEHRAAEYLCGETPGWIHRRLEAHLVDCEDCWTEVWLAREGRRMAEAGGEIAPRDLRDRVRAAVMFSVDV
jgi:hypothetical protein